MSEPTKKVFLIEIKKTFDAYNTFGARSNKKLIPIHSWLANEILGGLSDEYEVKSLGYGGECVISGKYYPKVVDITITHKLKPVVTISFKFVTSNYAQNSNNYFENLLGETANIRRTGVGFAHFLVLRGHTPYYDKAAGNKRGREKRTEVLTEHQIQKYIKLFKDVDFPHKPDVLGMVIIDFDDQNKPFFTDLKNLGLSNDAAKMFEIEFSIETFIKKVIALCNLKS